MRTNIYILIAIKNVSLRAQRSSHLVTWNILSTHLRVGNNRKKGARRKKRVMWFVCRQKIDTPERILITKRLIFKN